MERKKGRLEPNKPLIRSFEQILDRPSNGDYPSSFKKMEIEEKQKKEMNSLKYTLGNVIGKLGSVRPCIISQRPNVIASIAVVANPSLW